jgi:predicted ester cyclase
MERRAAERLVERWLHEAVGAGKIEVFDELVHADARDLSQEIGRGSEPFKQRASAVHAAFARIETSLDELVVEGDKLAWRWRLTGRHVGSFSGVAASGRLVTLRGVNFQCVEDGRVKEHWTLADTFGLLQALR